MAYFNSFVNIKGMVDEVVIDNVATVPDETWNLVSGIFYYANCGKEKAVVMSKLAYVYLNDDLLLDEFDDPYSTIYERVMEAIEHFSKIEDYEEFCIAKATIMDYTELIPAELKLIYQILRCLYECSVDKFVKDGPEAGNLEKYPDFFSYLAFIVYGILPRYIYAWADGYVR